MKYRADVLKRKAKCRGTAGKKARSKLRKLKLLDKVRKDEAKLRNFAMLAAFNEVNKQVGDRAQEVFQHYDWRLTKKQRAEKLDNMINGKTLLPDEEETKNEK